MADGPRLLRPVGSPLGNYLRPGRNDHRALLALLAEGHTDMSGLVFDACWDERHAELRTEAQDHGLETVLDPRTIELATEGGITRGGITELPWATGELPHTPKLLNGPAGEQMAESIAQHVDDKDFSAVLASTHYIADARDPWLDVDGKLVRTLRDQLDGAGRQETCIYYPLAVPGSMLRNPLQRQALIAKLSRLPIDALWLRVHPFGTTSSGPVALKRYIEACRDLQALGIPLVAERTGTVGVALLAFGAVGGVESGVTYGERYDVSGLLKPPSSGTPFSPGPRVYLPELGAFLTREQAREFFANRRMRTLFACRVPGCCRHGAADMDIDPKRHFILRRSGEISYYSKPPEPLRAGLYLEEFLRPATDLALRAVKVAPALESTRKRLEHWRNTLGAMHQKGLPATVAAAPTAKRVQPRHQLGA